MWAGVCLYSLKNSFSTTTTKYSGENEDCGSGTHQTAKNLELYYTKET